MSARGVGYKPESLVVGGLLTAAAFFCVALVNAFVKVAGQYTSTGVILLFQNAICLAFITPIALRGGVSSLGTRRIGLHILRATAGTACWYSLFVAITMIPLTNAILLTYSAPLWMPVIAFMVFRQRAAKVTWIGALIGFAGVVLVLQPAGRLFNVGALFLAVALMTVRSLGATEPATRILFYYFLISTLLVAPIAALDWQPFPSQAWMPLIWSGLAQFFSQLLLVLAYRYASAVKVGPIVYSVIVFTALIDWIVWDHPPTLLVFVGMAMVIGGGLIAIRAKPRSCALSSRRTLDLTPRQ